MTAITLITLPLTIANEVLQREERAKQEKNQKRAAAHQAKIAQQKHDIAQQQQQLQTTAAKKNLHTKQKAARDALRAYYYQSGINPKNGSAQNALNALSQKNAADLALLEEETNLKRQALSLNAPTPYRDNHHNDNPFPDALSLINTIGRITKKLT
ncbi:MAG: hypothetical protein ACR2NY_01375 [Alphaproteobacteria bacterium]